MSVVSIRRGAVVLSLSIFGVLSLAACEKKTPAEKLGDKIEKAGDKVEDKLDESN